MNDHYNTDQQQQRASSSLPPITLHRHQQQNKRIIDLSDNVNEDDENSSSDHQAPELNNKSIVNQKEDLFQQPTQNEPSPSNTTFNLTPVVLQKNKLLSKQQKQFDLPLRRCFKEESKQGEPVESPCQVAEEEEEQHDESFDLDSDEGNQPNDAPQQLLRSKCLTGKGGVFKDDEEMNQFTNEFKQQDISNSKIESQFIRQAAFLEKQDDKMADEKRAANYIPKYFLKFDKRALFIFDVKWRARRYLIRLVRWRYFDYFMLTAIAGNSILLAVIDYTDDRNATIWNQWLDKIDKGFTAIFVMEATLKIIAYGLILHNRAYLKNPWNILDFAVVIIALISLIPSVPNFKSLRILRVLRPLRSIHTVPTMKRQIGALLMALPKMTYLLTFLLFFMFIFAILGIQIFQRDQYSRCRLTEMPEFDNITNQFTMWPMDLEQEQPCGGLYKCLAGTVCGTLWQYGIPLEEDNVRNQSKIEYGYLHFDNIGVAILEVFRVMTLGGWVDVMYNYMDSTGVIAVIYFPLLIVLGSFFLLNLFLAVIMESFSSSRTIIETKIKIKQLQNAQKLDSISSPNQNQKVGNFTDLIANLTHKIKAQKKLEEQAQEKLQQEALPETIQPEKEVEVIDMEVPTNKFRRLMLTFCEHKVFTNIINFSIVANTICLGLDRYPINELLQGRLDFVNIAFFSLFLIEMIAKLIGMGPKVYIRDRFNIFDAVIVSISIIDVVVSYSVQINTGKGAISALRAFRLIRIFKLIKTGRKLQAMINTISKSLKDIASFCVLLFLLIFIYILLGMELFAVQKTSHVNKDDPRMSFNSFIEALIVVFTVLTGEDWDKTMLSFAKNYGYFAIFFFMSLVVIGVMIFLNIFLAILLENFDEDQENENEEEPKQKAEPECVLTSILCYPFRKFKDFIKSRFINKQQEKSIQTDNNNNIGSLQLKSLESASPIKLENVNNNTNLDGQLSHLTLNRATTRKGRNTQLTLQSSNQETLNGSALALPAINFTQRHQVNIEAIKELDEEMNNIDLFQNDAQGMQFEEEQADLDPRNNDEASNNNNELDESQRIPLLEVNNEEGQGNMNLDEFQGNVIQQFTQRSQESEPDFNLQERERQPSLSLKMIPSEFNEKTQQKDNKSNMGSVTLPKPTPLYRQNSRFGNVRRMPSLPLLMMQSMLQRSNTLINMESKELCQGTSCYIFSNKNRGRLILAKLVRNPKFEMFILFLIITSSILLALDNPLNDPSSALVNVLFYSDIILTIFFAFESLFKIIVYGFIANGPRSYLRNSWNQIDFVIVVLSVISLIVSTNKLKIVKIIRLLRVMRPLRVISTNKGLKVGIQALFKAIPHFLNVIIIAMLYLIIFSIIGVNYFKGSFFSCGLLSEQTDEIGLSLDAVDTKWDCLNFGGEWINADQNFDNLPQAVFTLFQIATTEGWIVVMQNGIDARGFDLQPQENYNVYWCFYFMLFVVLGNFLVINLFAGVVVSTFNKEKNILDKNYILSDNQRKWIDQKRLILKFQPKKIFDYSENNFVRKVQILIRSKQFDIFILTVIVLNTITLSITWYDQPIFADTILGYINYTFAACFVLEAILKIIGSGYKTYFSQNDNIFDFFIVITSIVSSTVSIVLNLDFGASSTFIRALRISRIFKFVRLARQIKVLFQTVIVTIPSLTNIGGLLLLFLYMYSVLGVFLFADVQLQDTLDIHANFQSFGLAFLTLFRCATGEGWNQIMMDVMRSSNLLFQCSNQDFDYSEYVQNDFHTQGCGYQIEGLLFFLTYLLVVPIIFLNLFTAIILEGFEESNTSEYTVVQSEHLEKFVEVWAKFDSSGTGFIKLEELSSFLNLLGGQPLGWNRDFYEFSTSLQDEFMEELNIPTYNNFQHILFWDLLIGLVMLHSVNDKITKDYKGEEEDMQQHTSHIDSLIDSFKTDDDFIESDDPDNLSAVNDLIEFNKQELQQMREYHQKRIEMRLELEFEKCNVEVQDVRDVELLKLSEYAVKEPYRYQKDTYYTTAHLKAARRILTFLRDIVKIKRFTAANATDSQSISVKQGGAAIEGFDEAKSELISIQDPLIKTQVDQFKRKQTLLHNLNTQTKNLFIGVNLPDSRQFSKVKRQLSQISKQRSFLLKRQGTNASQASKQHVNNRDSELQSDYNFSAAGGGPSKDFARSGRDVGESPGDQITDNQRIETLPQNLPYSSDPHGHLMVPSSVNSTTLLFKKQSRTMKNLYSGSASIVEDGFNKKQDRPEDDTSYFKGKQIQLQGIGRDHLHYNANEGRFKGGKLVEVFNEDNLKFAINIEDVSYNREEEGDNSSSQLATIIAQAPANIALSQVDNHYQQQQLSNYDEKSGDGITSQIKFTLSSNQDYYQHQHHQQQLNQEQQQQNQEQKQEQSRKHRSSIKSSQKRSQKEVRLGEGNAQCHNNNEQTIYQQRVVSFKAHE